MDPEIKANGLVGGKMRAIESGQSVALDQRVKDGMVPSAK